jgi:hypothetical protein
MKAFFLIICFCIAFVSVASAQNYRAPQPKRERPNASLKQERIKKGTCQLFASVFQLNLSHTEIGSECPTSNTSCSAAFKIEVATVGRTINSDKFVYAVSAGKIIGSGANVIWDLSGARPGEYTITAVISMIRVGVVGQTQTRRVRVLD